MFASFQDDRAWEPELHAITCSVISSSSLHLQILSVPRSCLTGCQSGRFFLEPGRWINDQWEMTQQLRSTAPSEHLGSFPSIPNWGLQPGDHTLVSGFYGKVHSWKYLRVSTHTHIIEKNKTIKVHSGIKFNSRLWEAEVGTTCEFEASLVYIVSSRIGPSIAGHWYFLACLSS